MFKGVWDGKAMDQLQAGFAKESPYSYAAQRQEAPGAACKEEHRQELLGKERGTTATHRQGRRAEHAQILPLEEVKPPGFGDFQLHRQAGRANCRLDGLETMEDITAEPTAGLEGEAGAVPEV